MMGSNMTKRPISREASEASMAKDHGRDFVDVLLKTEEISRLMELHYWSNDEAVVEIARAVAALNDTSKDAIRSFVAWAQDPRTISAKLEKNGQLTLTAPRVTQTFALAKHVTKGEENDDEPDPAMRKSTSIKKVVEAA